MKALTLTQPWATLVAIGAKKIETRSWRTHYRGPLAIHAAKGFPSWAKDLCCEREFVIALGAAGIITLDQLPTGKIVAVCDLVGVETTGLSQGWGWKPDKGSSEWVFGDYSPGRFMWRLTNVRALPQPIPARGTLGLWTWETDGGLL